MDLSIEDCAETVTLAYRQKCLVSFSETFLTISRIKLMKWMKE